MGYYQAANELGIDVEITGVDIHHQDNYPFKFVQDDCIHYCLANYSSFDFFHFSPPCQKYSVGTNVHRAAGKKYPDIIKPIQTMIDFLKFKSVIENVPQAPIRADIYFYGYMFNLPIKRKRHFQIDNLYMLQPGVPAKSKSVHKGELVTVAGNGDLKSPSNTKLQVPGNTVMEVWQNAMQIPWMTKKKELAEAIPPAYTRYIGLQLFPQIN